MKSYKIVSVAGLTALLVAGCGGSSDAKDSGLSNLPTVSDETKILAKSIVNQSLFGAQSMQFGGQSVQTEYSNVALTGNTLPAKLSREVDSQSCENGGSMIIQSNTDPDTFRDPNFDFNDFNISTSLTYDNCMQGGMVSDGKMEMLITFSSDQRVNMTSTYITDFTMQDAYGIFTIHQGSTFKNEAVNENSSIMTESMKITYDAGSYEYESEALKMYNSFSGNYAIFYPISGKETIGDKSYTVDSSYDASTTPMKISGEGNIEKGGKFKYIDNQNHYITIEAIGTNKMQVSVDNDGDGKADQAEIVVL